MTSHNRVCDVDIVLEYLALRNFFCIQEFLLNDFLYLVDVHVFSTIFSKNLRSR